MSTNKEYKELKELDTIQVLKQSVVKSNEFIRRSQYSLTVVESKILNFILANIDTRAENFDKIKFPTYEFSNACGLSTANPGYIKDVIKKMADKSIAVKQKIYNADGVVEKESYVPIRWIGDWEVDITDGQIIIQLHERLKPFFLNLRKNYTKTELYCYLAFKCRYSFPLYDLFRSYINLTIRNGKPYTIKMTISEFRKLLNIEDKLLRFADVRARVIEPAMKEINQYTEIDAEYTTTKNKQAVSGINFIIYPKDVVRRMRVYEEAESRAGAKKRRAPETIDDITKDVVSKRMEEVSENDAVIDDNKVIVLESEDGQCFLQFDI